MIVSKIDTGKKKQVRKFIHFPFELYKGDGNWVPPMVSDMKFALNRSEHPFYKHSHADFFVAEDKGKVIGRIAVIDNQRYKAHTGENAGFFYFFEAIEDQRIARELFNTAFDWARNRSLDKIIGPKGLAQGDGLGMLVEGFDFKPSIGITYNPKYYNDFLIDSGFRKETDYLSGFLKADYVVPKRIYQLAERVKERRGFWVKNFESKEEIRTWIPKIREVYNQAFVDVPTFVPITEDEVHLIANRILSIADPHLIKLIFKGEALIGFLFSYHNISDGIQKSKGKLYPFGWFHLLRAFKTTRWVDINGIGLLPGHQGLGATAVLYSELEKSIRSYPFKIADLVQVAETNKKSFGEMDNLGVSWHKRHRIYQRVL
jgi:GNAT superfamily N-acetyltransferase